MAAASMPAVLPTKKAASPMKANGLNSLCVLGERTKGSTEAGKARELDRQVSDAPSAKLLRIIAQAIAPTHKRNQKATGGASQC